MKKNHIYIDDNLFEAEVFQDKTENNQDVFNDTGVCKAIKYYNVPDPNDPEIDPMKVRRIPEVVIDMIGLHEYLHMTKEMICAGFPLLKKYLGNQDGDGGLVTVVSDKVKTAATDGNHIFFNPLFVWRLANTNTLNRGGEICGFDYVDEGIVFIYMHEIYHCMFLHHLREAKFGKNRQGGVDHLKANLVQDQEINSQLESYCGFDQTLKDGKQVGTVNTIHGVLFNSNADPRTFNKVPKEFEDMIYNPAFEYEGEDYEGNSMKYTRRFPSKFGAQWEEMYEWFEKNGWPEMNQDDPFTPDSEGSNDDSQQLTGDQDIYDEGYYDGYRGLPDKSKTSQNYNREDYKEGYKDGQKWSLYDKTHNSCNNDPDYLAGKEYAENNMNESSVDSYFDTLSEAFKNINTESPAYKKAIEDFNNKRNKTNQSSSNKGKMVNREDTNSPDNTIDRRNNQQQSQPQNNQSNKNQSTQKQKNQEGSNIQKRGKENSEAPSNGEGQGEQGQEQGGEGQSGQGKGNGGSNNNNSGTVKRHQGVDKDGNPVKNNQQDGNYDEDNPYEINRKAKPDDFDWGKMRDQLSEEEGAEIIKDLGRLFSDKQNNIDNKWKNKINKNGMQGLPDGSDMAANAPGGVAHGCGKDAGIWATMERIKEAMKSTVNWQDMLMGYIKGAFKASRERINKKSYNNPDGIITKIERDNGGDSIGHVAFAIDNSGSMWGKGTASFEKFFKEITKIREKIGKPIKAVITFPFTAGDGAFIAKYFKDGEVKPDMLSVDKNGGTDFNQIFTLMKAGEVYNEQTRKKIWRGINDVVDFPVVTVIMTDGEDDIPQRDTSWDFDRHCLIWFVINTSQSYVDSFREQLMKKGYNAKYYIGITTDQI